MNLRFRIQEPTPDGHGEINNQPLAPINKTGLSLAITIDNDAVINIADLSVFSPPISGTTTDNGIAWTLTLEDTNYLKLTLDYKKSGIWQSTSVQITATKTGYLPFDNTFVVYNYDIGNNSNQNYNDGNPITSNPEFNVILINETGNVVSGVQTKNYANFLVLRKPYTNLIYFYKNHSGQGISDYTDESSNVIANGANAVYSGTLGIEEFIAVNTLTGATNAQSDSQILNAVSYVPNSSLAVSQAECNTSLTEECYNYYGTITGSLVIDFTGLSQFYLNDTVVYPFEVLQVYYQVYDKDGTLLETAIYNGQVPDATFVYNPEDWDHPLSISSIGDHIVIGGFKIFGLDTENLITSGDLEINTIYRIVANSGGADFTVGGATDNNVGTEFAYNGGVITWGTGGVEELSPAVHCLKKETVTGCLFYKIEQTACNTFTLFSNSFTEIQYTISKLDDNGTFVETVPSTVVNGLQSATLSLTSDGVYQVQVEKLDDDGNVTNTIIQVIFVYCSLSACLLTKIDSLVCCNTNNNCDNDKIYDFNALVISAHTYFNILNAEYNFNYFYTALDADKLNELRDANQFLTQIAGYCEECTSGYDKDANCTNC